MNMKEKYVKINFSFTDEYEQESNLTKTFNPAVFDFQNTFDFLVEEFKNFMICAGFNSKSVDKIVVLEIDEDGDIV